MTMTITPRVDQHILSEIPRFFTDRESMFRELIQNAVRAGANRLTITGDEQQLNFEDDGPGLSDPQLLLTVAQSGWQGNVRDPAGMGVLSTLNPDYVTAVTFTSHKWAFTITPDQFRTATPIPVEEVPFQTGFQVNLKLNQPGPHTKLNIKTLVSQSRARAPITVILNGEEVPPEQLKGEVLTIPEGSVYLENHFSSVNSRSYWEGFPIRSSLGNYIEKHLNPSSACQVLLNHYRIVFIPDPQSGVLPKLPDRNAMLENEAWARAATHLQAALQTKISTLMSSVELAPLINHSTALSTLRGKSTLGHSTLSRLLTAHLHDQGYSAEDVFTAKTSFYVSEDGENDEVENSDLRHVRKSDATDVSAEEVGGLLLQQERDPNLPLVYTGDADGNSGRNLILIAPWPDLPPANPVYYSLTGKLTLCQNLNIAGVPLSWHVRDTQIYLLGSAQDAEQTLRQQGENIAAAFLQALYIDAEIRDTFLVDGDETLTTEQIKDWLLEALIERYFPLRQQAHAERQALRATRSDIDLILHTAEKLPQYSTEFAAVKAKLQVDRENIIRRIEELTNTHRLVD